jgi:CheY-like chemotaxis protein
MESVEGTGLDQVLAERGPLPVAEACAYACQAALGLQHAHERGMVHRDIKPHNLMLTPEGRVKILDFGLSRLASELAPAGSAGDALRPEDCDRMTPSDTGLGTADYMAPEEARDASHADIRADIYSLGCTLYHFLTGEVPFPGGSYRSKLRRHASWPAPPVTNLRPDVPAPLAGLVARLLAKEPSERLQTPVEVARALAPYAAPSGRYVLVVDDDPVACRAMAKILEAEGFTVTMAGNGREALDRLHEGPLPSLILLDLAMPVMDGFQFLHEQRKDPTLATIPVVVVSAVDPAQAQAAALGAAAYLRKPIEVDELAGKVRHHTGHPS